MSVQVLLQCLIHSCLPPTTRRAELGDYFRRQADRNPFLGHRSLWPPDWTKLLKLLIRQLTGVRIRSNSGIDISLFFVRREFKYPT